MPPTARRERQMSHNQPQNKERILIKGAYLMTQDNKLGNFVGDVLVADGRIVEVGRDLSDDRARVVEGTGNAVLPGFIDTHRHNWQGALRNLGPAWTYEEYRSNVQIGLGQHFEPRDVHVGNLAADLMSLDSGVTTVRDESHISNSPEHSDAAIAAHWESGIRAVFDHGWPSTEAEQWQFGSNRTHPADIRRIRDEVLSDDSARVTLNAMLRGPELSTPEVSAQDIRLARELGLRISMHVGLGEWGADQQAIRQLAETGLLASDMTFIHCCTSTDEELRMLAAHGATASVAGALEVFMPGLGQPATNRLLAAGVRPSLSVDTETIVSGDMFGVMRATLAYQQLILADAAGPMDRIAGLPTFDAADLLSFATIEGARAAGIDNRTGSLTPGKEADLIMIRLDHANLLPATNVAATIVAGGHAGNVDMVVVAGDVLKENGVLKAGDTVFDEAAASRDRLFHAAGLPLPA
ncbi:amidohydrolase family protein [Streptomyces thinghirensis]|uniref:Amidohydrolase family protein n=2 Tax=Streptomyces thinghirensis TaxID=551547 RepID=A0ABP9TCS4_9ACTN